VGLDGIGERLVGPRRGDDADRDPEGRAPVLDALPSALPEIPVIVLHDVVDVVGIAIGRPHQAEEGLVPGQPFPDHVHVDVAERLLHERLVGLDPQADARELGAPDEADGPLGPGQAALLDERVEDAGDLEDAGAAGDVVVGPLLLEAFEKMRRQDDLAGGRIGARDAADDVLEVDGLGLGLDHGPGGDLLAREQPALEDVALAGVQLEGELRLLAGGLGLFGPRPAAAGDARPGHLERVLERPRRADGDDPQRPLLDRGPVGRPEAPLADGDPAVDLGLLDLLGRPPSDPDQLGRDVGRGAAGGQHRQHVVDGGDLPPSGLRFPQLALERAPGLPAGVGDDLDARQPVLLELAEDDPGLEEEPGVLVVEPLAVEGVDLGDRVPGRLAGGLADDLVHLALRQERPIEPRRVLGGENDGHHGPNSQGHRPALGHADLLWAT